MALRFSIIVPTLNRRSMLAEALASIERQNWADTQVIIADGGSTDGTLEMCASLPGVSVMSGPDQGVYDALNKGLAQADGDVVGLLNSDDGYEAGAFAAVAKAFEAQPDADAVCGAAVLEEDGNVLMTFDRASDQRLAAPRTVLIGPSVLNARFFRRKARAMIGPFDIEYRYVADRDWLARWYEAGSLTTIAIPDLVYRYRRHSGSLTFAAERQEEAIREEQVRLARKWQRDPRASRRMVCAAYLLEGRCLYRLVAAELRRRNPRGALRWLCLRDGKASVMPPVVIAASGLDWVLRYFASLLATVRM